MHVPICDWMLSKTDYNNTVQTYGLLCNINLIMMWWFCATLQRHMLQQNCVCSECIVRNTSPKDREISQGWKFSTREIVQGQS